MNNHRFSYSIVRYLVWLAACCQYFSLSLPVSTHLDLSPATIIWNPVASQQMFSAKKTQNVQLNQKINIACPNSAIAPGVDPDHMYENIWLVDQRGFETCSLNLSNPDHRLLQLCSDPTKVMFRSIVFAPMTISGHSYQPGKTYYIIATSTGANSSLNNTSGGNCLTKNMKIAFYVCKNKTDPSCQKAVTRTKAKECNVGKSKRMKTVIRKLEGLSETLSINSKQLIDLKNNSKDMDGKIEEVLEMMNKTKLHAREPQRFRKHVYLTLTLQDVELKKGDEVHAVEKVLTKPESEIKKVNVTK